MRIIFMGTPEFAAPAIDSLIAAGHEIAAVFSQPDKPKGRGYALTPPPVKVRAMEHNIPVYQPTSMKDGEALKIFHDIQPDVGVVIAYGKILPKDILDAPRYGCINVHASLLPKYRGAAPIQWSVIDGEPKTGVTTMQMDVGLDTGDMLMKAELDIGENETADELHDRLSELGAQLIVKTVHAADKGELVREKQDDSKSCYASMLTKEMSRIDFSRPASEVHNKVRGLNSWPGASAVFGGKRIKIHRTVLRSESGEPGRVISLEPLIVACGEGSVELAEVQPEGRKKMTAAAFVNGLHCDKAKDMYFS